MSFCFLIVLNVIKVSIHIVEDRLAKFIAMLKTLYGNGDIVPVKGLDCLNTLVNSRKCCLLVCFFVAYELAARIDSRSRSPPSIQVFEICFDWRFFIWIKVQKEESMEIILTL